MTAGPETRRALQAAYRLLARRDHSELELERKLLQRGFPPRNVAAAQRECRRLGYLDDRRWARARAEGLQDRGYGRRHIRSEIIRKGLAEPLAEEVLADCCRDSDQLAAARRAVRKKMPAFEREPDPYRRRARIYRFLHARGFSGDLISRLLDAGSPELDNRS